jgi:hypothetical protein
MPNRRTVLFVVIVGETFDDLSSPESTPPRNPWFKRLLWWLIATSAAAVLGYELTKLLP